MGHSFLYLCISHKLGWKVDILDNILQPLCLLAPPCDLLSLFASSFSNWLDHFSNSIHPLPPLPKVWSCQGYLSEGVALRKPTITQGSQCFGQDRSWWALSLTILSCYTPIIAIWLFCFFFFSTLPWGHKLINSVKSWLLWRGSSHSPCLVLDVFWA